MRGIYSVLGVIDVNKFLLPLVFVVTISLVIGYQDAAAMTVLFENPLDGPAIFIGEDATTIILADDFLLSTGAIVEDVHFFIFDPDVVFDDVVFFTIYPDLAGAPDTTSPIASGSGTNVMAMPDTLGVGCLCFEVWFDIVPTVPLSAGTYWIALSGQTPWQVIFDNTQELLPMHVSVDGGFSFFSFSGFGVPFTLTGTIGGTLIPIDTTILLLAGVQSISMWMIPVVAAGVGIGVLVIKRRK